jgi:uncharacterized membrane protein SpoIIM required for sporulation
MNADTFLQQRRPAWERMEHLLATLRRSPQALSAQELEEFGRLYRAATSDLALAQRDFPQAQVTQYLNQLVGGAHAALYRGEPLRWRQLRDLYARQFPRLYRKLLPYTAAAFVLFLLGAVAAFFAVWAVPDRIYVVEGPGIAPLVDQVEQGELWTEIEPAVRSAASSLILTNNIQVMFLTFAGGMTAGLYTAWILLSNGLHLGAIFGLLQVHGLAGGLGEFVVAHGFIELSVIFLAGGCGLYIGDGLLRPGLYSRPVVLRQRAREGGMAILACIPLLVLAGLIEGFVSPSGLPWPLKASVGVGTGIALYWYWLRVGRDEKSQPASEEFSDDFEATLPTHKQEGRRAEGEDLFL